MTIPTEYSGVEYQCYILVLVAGVNENQLLAYQLLFVGFEVDEQFVTFA